MDMIRVLGRSVDLPMCLNGTFGVIEEMPGRITEQDDINAIIEAALLDRRRGRRVYAIEAYVIGTEKTNPPRVLWERPRKESRAKCTL